MQQFSKKSIERQKEESRKALEESRLRKDKFELEKRDKARKKVKIIAAVSIVLLVSISLSAYSLLSPGKFDGFAKCLTEKGAVMYGEDWCKYTQGQKGMFGKSFKYVNYEVKSDLRFRPTWVINGEIYEKVQSFERLSALTGCDY